MSVHRITRRVVNLPADMYLVERTDYGKDRNIRPARLTETLTQENGRADQYTVVVWGPVITAKGNEHKFNRGDAAYGEGYPAREPLSALPDQFREHVVGAVVLASEEAVR